MRRRLWWVQAPGVAAVVIMGPALAALWLSPGAYVENWRTPKVFDVWTFWRVTLAAGCIVVGAFLARSRRRPAPDGEDGADADADGVVAGEDLEELVGRDLAGLYRTAFKVLWTLAMAGNLVLLAIGLGNGFRPSQILVLLSGESDLSYGLKQETFSLVPGVTTTTQFGLAAAVLAGIIGPSASNVVRRQLIALVALTALRSLVVSERLALIEILVPFAIAVLGRKLRAGWRPSRRFALVPLMAVPALVVFFSAFEFTRSWSAYSDENPSLLGFGATRLEGYYVTALNNSEVTWQNRNDLYPLPYHTLDFYWSFPGLSELTTYEESAGVDPDVSYPNLLRREANPEFTNPGGIGALYAEYGVPLAAGICLLLGFAARRSFDAMLAGRQMGMLLYPLLFLALLELPRIWYLTSGRAFPSLVALVVVALLGAARRRRTALRARRMDRADHPWRDVSGPGPVAVAGAP